MSLTQLRTVPPEVVRPRARRLGASRLGAALRDLSARQLFVALYLLCALPLGVFMALAVPLGQAPDEPAHMARAEGLLHGAILTDRKNPDITGVEVDTGLFAVSFGKITEIDGRPVMTQADYWALRNMPSQHQRIFAQISNTGPYFPSLYLPAVLGLAFGLACKLSPFLTMMLARLCMLAAALLLGSLALYVAEYGQALLLCLLLLPMTLSLDGSLNQDGGLIALACVSAAAMTRDFVNDRKFRWLALLPLVLVLSAKPPYLPLLGLLLLPLEQAGFWRRVRDMVLAAIPVLVWVALVVAFVIVAFGKPPYHPGPLYTGDPNSIFGATDTQANLHILLAKPERFFTMPYQLLTGLSGLLTYDSMIGILGWLDLIFPQRFYLAWSLALATALLGLIFAERQSQPPARRPLAQLLYVGLLLAAAYWAITISLYLTWTLVGNPTIQGFQGRYFLVLAPFLLAAVANWGSAWRIPAIVPALPAIALGIYDLGYVPLKVIAFYYMY